MGRKTNFILGLIFGISFLAIRFFDDSPQLGVCANKRRGKRIISPQDVEYLNFQGKKIKNDMFVECDGQGNVLSTHECNHNEYFSDTDCKIGDRCYNKQNGFTYSLGDNTSVYYKCLDGESEFTVCDLGFVYEKGKCIKSDRCFNSTLSVLEILPDTQIIYCDHGKEARIDCKEVQISALCNCIQKSEGYKFKKPNSQSEYFECHGNIAELKTCQTNEYIGEDFVCKSLECRGKPDNVPFIENLGNIGYKVCIDDQVKYIACATNEFFDPLHKRCSNNPCLNRPKYKYLSDFDQSYFQCESNGLPRLINCGEHEIVFNLECVADMCSGLAPGTKLTHDLIDHFFQCGVKTIYEKKCNKGLFLEGNCHDIVCTFEGEKIADPTLKSRYIFCGEKTKLMTCPEFHYFQTSSSQCQMNPCIDNKDRDDPASRLNYLSCAGGFPEKKRCPEGTMFETGRGCVDNPCFGKDDEMRVKISIKSFVICQNELPEHSICQTQEFFDDVTKICEINRCISQANDTKIEGKLNAYFVCKDEIPFIDYCGVNEFFYLGECRENVCLNEPNLTKIVNPYNRNSYFRCSDNYPNIFWCDVGHYFENDCKPNVCFQNNRLKIAHPERNKYLDCSTGIPRLESCSAGKFFDIELMECISNTCQGVTAKLSIDSKTKYADCSSGFPVISDCPTGYPIFNGQQCVENQCKFEGEIISRLKIGTHQKHYEICANTLPVTIKCEGFFNGKNCEDSFCHSKSKTKSQFKNIFFICENGLEIPQKCQDTDFLDNQLECRPNVCISEKEGYLINSPYTRLQFFVCIDHYPEIHTCSLQEYADKGCKSNPCAFHPKSHVFSNEKDSKTYFECLTGFPVISRCPLDKVFDGYKCVDLGCVGKSDNSKLPVSDDRFSFLECEGGIETRRLCPRAYFFSHNICTENPCFEKSTNVKFPTPDKTGYYTCKGGIPSFFKCQESSSFFDPEISACSISRCVGERSYGATMPNTYYSCLQFPPKLLHCDSNQYFDNLESFECKVNPCIDPSWKQQINAKSYLRCEDGFPEIKECLQIEYFNGTHCLPNPCLGLAVVNIPMFNTPSRNYIKCSEGYPTSKSCSFSQFFSGGACINTPCVNDKRTAPIHIYPSLEYVKCTTDLIPSKILKCPQGRVYDFETDGCVSNHCHMVLQGNRSIDNRLSNRYFQCISGLPHLKMCDNIDHLFIEGICTESVCKENDTRVAFSLVPGKRYYDCQKDPPEISECEGQNYFDMTGKCAPNFCLTDATLPTMTNGYFTCTNDNFPKFIPCNQGDIYFENRCQSNPCANNEDSVPVAGSKLDFYKCENKMPIKKTCGRGEWFNIDHCSPNLCTGIRNERIHDPNNAFGFYECDQDMLPTVKRCPLNSQFFENLKTCSKTVCQNPNGQYPYAKSKFFYKCKNYIPTLIECPKSEFYCTNHKKCHIDPCADKQVGDKVFDKNSTAGFVKCTEENVGEFVKCQDKHFFLGSFCVSDPCILNIERYIVNSPREYYSCHKGYPDLGHCDIAYVNGKCVKKNPCENQKEHYRFKTKNNIFDFYECRNHQQFFLPYKSHCNEGEFFIEQLQACVKNECGDESDGKILMFEDWRTGHVQCSNGVPFIRNCVTGKYFDSDELTCKDNICKSTNPVGHTEHSKYFDCSQQYPILKHCGGPLMYFNKESLQCEKNPCADNKPFIRLTPPRYIECISDYPHQKACFAGEVFSGHLSQPCVEDACHGRTGFLASTGSKTYVDCTGDWPVIKHCDQFFDAIKGACSTSSCYGLAEGSFLANTTSITSYYKCENLTPVFKRCELDYVFYLDTKRCEKPRCIDREKIHDANSINKYYVCLPNLFFKHETCPSNQIFDRDRLKCIVSPCMGAENDVKIANDSLSGFYHCFNDMISYHACNLQQYYRHSILECKPNVCLGREQGAKISDPYVRHGYLACSDRRIPVEYNCSHNEIFWHDRCKPNVCFRKNDGYNVRDPEDISRYIVCVGERPSMMNQCNHKEIFIEENQSCHKNVCREGTWPHETDRTMYYSCHNKMLKITKCNSGQIFTQDLGCVINPCFKNPIGFRYGSETNQREYFECDNKFQPINKICPEGLYFVTDRCVEKITPQMVCPRGMELVYDKCELGRCSIKEEGKKTPHWSDDNLFLLCHHGTMQITQCPQNQIFNEKHGCQNSPCIFNSPTRINLTDVLMCYDGISQITRCDENQINVAGACHTSGCIGDVRFAKFPIEESSFVDCHTKTILNCGPFGFFSSIIQDCTPSSCLFGRKSGYLSSNAYIVCEEGKIVGEYECPNYDMVYSVENGRCFYPQPCKIGEMTQIDRLSYYMCEEDRIDPISCPENRVYNSVIKQCQVDPCEDTTDIVVHGSEQQFYVTCHGGKFNEAFQCPEGKIMFSLQKTCIPAECKSRKNQRIDFAPNFYLDCENIDSPQIKRCEPDDLVFDYGEDKCVENQCAGKSNLLAIPGRVEFYVDCLDWHTTKKCQDGFRFILNQCVNLCTKVDHPYKRYKDVHFFKCENEHVYFKECPIGFFPFLDDVCLPDLCDGHPNRLIAETQNSYRVCSDGKTDTIQSCPIGERFSPKHEICVINRCLYDTMFVIDEYKMDSYVFCGPPIEEKICPFDDSSFDFGNKKCAINRCHNKPDGYILELNHMYNYFVECDGKRNHTVHCNEKTLNLVYNRCV